MSVQEIIAALAGLTAAERRQVRHKLDTIDDAPAREHTGETAYDRARHLIRHNDAPDDLASNKAYLRDLGERTLS